MDRSSWVRKNKDLLGSRFEERFVESVLGMIPDIDYSFLEAQMPFRDQDGKQRYCDFVIREGAEVRIAIEVDGYDKTGTGQGMTHEQFVDWQRRHASLVAQGWDVIRFANRDVMNSPDRCAYLLQLLLRRERAKSQHGSKLSEMIDHLREEMARKESEKAELHERLVAENRSSGTAHSGSHAGGKAAIVEHLRDVLVDNAKEEESLQERLESLTDQLELARKAGGLTADEKLALDQHQKDQGKIAELKKEGDVMKTTIWAFAAIIIAGMGLFVFQGADRFSSSQAPIQAAPAQVAPVQAEPVQTAPVQETLLAGSSCDNPLSWRAAKGNVGEVLALSGPVIRATTRDDVRGSPTWIDVGAAFPTSDRLVLVIWGGDREKFESVLSEGLDGKSICAIGEVGSYNGVPQIVLKERSQIHL
ncbi:DUF559 domain-containing protein [Halomonas mongoliensis]|uniref:DUF559 domain-containing protein n=1 Tax=Halomonas mongoliensis TaxID=321265 RepID=UPI00403B27A7